MATQVGILPDILIWVIESKLLFLLHGSKYKHSSFYPPSNDEA